MTSKPISFFGIDRENQRYEREYGDIFRRVMASGQMLAGEETAKLEARIELLLSTEKKQRYAVALNSGTDALFFALKACGVGPGDRVLVSAYSFIASASCILRAGGVPVFVDIDRDYLLDLDKVGDIKGIKAMIFVDLYGNMPDAECLQDFCKDRDLFLIEDACQSFGDRRAGTIGDFSCISFDPTKVLAAPGCGGMVLCNKPDAEYIRKIRHKNKCGENSQMSELTAAILNFKMDYLFPWIQRRREIAEQYGCNHVFKQIQDMSGTFQKYVLASDVLDRDKVVAYFASKGVPCMTPYNYTLPEQLGSIVEHPVAEKASREVFSLPMHPWMTKDEVEYIVEAIDGVVP